MPNLTSTQLSALKAVVSTDPLYATEWANGDDAGLASKLNTKASPDYYVWQDLSMEAVLNLITFANMTPVDAPDGTQLWANRSLACQGKQFNLQNLTIGRSTAPMKRTNYRAAMQDALTNLPAGAAGALINANWVGVRDAAKRLATNAEKILATGSGTQGSPSDVSYEGPITADDVVLIRKAA